jgi:hypothetical protein
MGSGVEQEDRPPKGLGEAGRGATIRREHGSSGISLRALLGADISSLVLALLGDSLVVGGAAAFLTGLFFGPIWPLIFSIATEGGRGNAPAVMVTVGGASSELVA